MPRTNKKRGPKVKARDPELEMQAAQMEPPKRQCKPRRYIAASMPCVCPECGHNTRMDDGRHVDPVRQRILEYRTCSKCAAKLAAGRPMTERECEQLCSRAEAVAEYEKITLVY